MKEELKRSRKKGICEDSLVTEGEKKAYREIFQRLYNDSNPENSFQEYVLGLMAKALLDITQIAKYDSEYHYNEGIGTKIGLFWDDNPDKKPKNFFLEELEISLPGFQDPLETPEEIKKLQSKRKKIGEPHKLFIKYYKEAETRFRQLVKLWKSLREMD